MTTQLKVIVAAALALVAVITAVLLAGPRLDLMRILTPNKSLNILVVSACSLRTDRLGVYNPGFAGSPRIDEWAKGAFVFTNAIAEKPWQNFNFEANEVINRMTLAANGYTPFKDQKFGHRFIIPPVETASGGDEEWFWSEDAILKYGESLNHLKKVMSKKRTRPTFIFTHLKYMHYPYLDTINLGRSDFQWLSPTSQNLLNRYRANPGQYEDRLPLIEVLTNNFKLLEQKFGLTADKVLSVSGVISDVQRARRWRSAQGYADDLRLVEELYNLKMRHFDEMAADLLNLYGDAEAQKNTVVIFTGDHGEAMMEHGVLGHSVNVYEEMLKFPLLVKFPQAHGRPMAQQINHKIMADAVHQMIEGRIDHKNFANAMEQRAADYLIARNCQDDIRAVRYRSEWKLIKNLRTNKAELYNLVEDPGELRDLAETNPQMAWKLEEYLVSHQDDFKRVNKREQKSKVCISKL